MAPCQQSGRLPVSPSTALAAAALAVALGGTSYAAAVQPANSVGTKQLRDAAVGSSNEVRRLGVNLPVRSHADPLTRASRGSVRPFGALVVTRSTAAGAFSSQGSRAVTAPQGARLRRRRQGGACRRGRS